MAKKSTSLQGNTEHMALLAKALGSKTGGKAPADRENITVQGDFQASGTITYNLKGNVTKDHEKDNFYGVKLDTVITYLVATCGATEDAIRRNIEITTEIMRAEIEEREPQAFTYETKDGQGHLVTIDEINEATAAVERIQGKVEDALAPFAKAIKTTRPCKGQVKLADVEITCIADTGATAKAN